MTKTSERKREPTDRSLQFYLASIYRIILSDAGDYATNAADSKALYRIAASQIRSPQKAPALVPASLTHPSQVQIDITTPSRLHFGLLSFGGSGRQFGGVGVMIDHPHTQLCIRPAKALRILGSSAERVQLFVDRWTAHHATAPPPCEINVTRIAPAHCGLGSGTQLALAVAAGLNAFCQRPPETARELALSVGRGLRSAVGTYGFVQGGLIVERGKLPTEAISPLDCRIELPAAWRFVLARPQVNPGLSGPAEQAAFATVPAVPATITQRLGDLLRKQVIPAIMQTDFDNFAHSITEYGQQAGMCFAALQGGPYNGPRLTELIKVMQELGATGVGQSSWGPTLFALMRDQTAAEQFATRLQACEPDVQIDITAGSPHGALLRRVPV